MRKLIVFNMMSLDGYIADAKGDMSWAHKQDAEWNAFVAGNAKGECAMVFGRITYEMMANWWPTPQAKKTMPVVAERMNRAPKVVFSRTLEQASWNNTKLVKSDPAAAVRKLKQEPGPDLMIFGSGAIISQLAPEGLIDEFQLVVNPIALGNGKSMFDHLKKRLTLKLARTRTFSNGNVMLCYEPVP